MLTSVQLLNVYLKAYTNKVASDDYTVKEAGVLKAVKLNKSALFNAIRKHPLLVKGLGLKQGITAGMSKSQKRRLMRRNFDSILPAYGLGHSSKGDPLALAMLQNAMYAPTTTTGVVNSVLPSLPGVIGKHAIRSGKNGTVHYAFAGKTAIPKLKEAGRVIDSNRGVLDHEYGHFIANKVLDKGILSTQELRKLIRNMRTRLSLQQRRAANTHLTENIIGTRKPLRETVKARSELYKGKKTILRADESFADGFSDYMSSFYKPSDIARANNILERNARSYIDRNLTHLYPDEFQRNEMKKLIGL